MHRSWIAEVNPQTESMDWLQFFASAISSLAWPIAAVILVFFLRKPLTDILITLTRIKNLKFKDLELDFSNELQDIKRTVTDSAPSEQNTQTLQEKRSGEESLESAQSEQEIVTNTYMAEAMQLISSNFPEPAVLVAWRAVEEALVNVGFRLGMEAGIARPVVAPGRAIALLREKGFIHTSTAEAIYRLRSIRNKVAHGSQGKSKVSIDDAEEFTNIAASITETLNGLAK